MADQYSTGVSAGINSSVSLDNNRRKFAFGDRVAELAPQQSPFFVYLNKVAKKPTNDPVFKFLEQRHQWQRRNFQTTAEFESSAAGAIWTSGTASTTNYTTVSGNFSDDDVTVDCGYDAYGNISAGSTCPFLQVNTMVAIEGKFASDGSTYNTDVIVNYYVDTVDSASQVHLTFVDCYGKDGTTITTASGSKIKLEDNANGQVVGTTYQEGDTVQASWKDSLYDREGYCQIFKTPIDLFSGTAMATEYRGVKNEYQRVWSEKLMEHKMDIEHAMLFGVGRYGTETNNSTQSATRRYSWGMLPYTSKNGKIYGFKYSDDGYDAFLDAMEDFFAPESGNSGNKLVLASRRVISYLNKLGSSGFFANTVGNSATLNQYKLDVNSIPGSFGHTVTKVNTIFGNLHFVAEPLLRGPWADMCVAVDMKNVAYRPLSGNGISRDTFIETNIQNNNVDGRQDVIITEAGLEISLPETHAILSWS